MRFIFLYLFLNALTKSAFANTVILKEQDDLLLIKPRYTPLIPTFIIRFIIAIMAIGIILLAGVAILNHRKFDEELIVIGLFLFLGIYSLWVLFRATRRTLERVVIPVTIFSKNHQEVVVGENRRIAFDKLHGIMLTNDGQSGGHTIIRIDLMEDCGHYLMGAKLCYVVYKDREVYRLVHRFVNRILSYILPPSTSIAEQLTAVDWERLCSTQGYHASILIFGDDSTFPPVGSDPLPLS